jgi:hypothetical protein
MPRTRCPDDCSDVYTHVFRFMTRRDLAFQNGFRDYRTVFREAG